MKVIGLFALKKDQIANICKRPFLGLLFVDDDGDTTSRLQSLDDLGVVKSEYDDADQSWYFEVEVDDDDWWNADHKPLRSLLAELLAVPAGRGIVISKEEWKGAPSDVMLVTAGGGVISKMIVDKASDDADLISVERAMELVGEIKWPRATRLFESQLPAVPLETEVK